MYWYVFWACYGDTIAVRQAQDGSTCVRCATPVLEDTHVGNQSKYSRRKQASHQHDLHFHMPSVEFKGSS